MRGLRVGERLFDRADQLRRLGDDGEDAVCRRSSAPAPTAPAAMRCPACAVAMPCSAICIAVDCASASSSASRSSAGRWRARRSSSMPRRTLVDAVRVELPGGREKSCVTRSSCAAGSRTTPMPTWVTSRLRMLARWPGEFMRPRCASPGVEARATFSRISMASMLALRVRSAAEPVVGETWPKKPCASMSAECARATAASAASHDQRRQAGARAIGVEQLETRLLGGGRRW